ncbi:perlucin [Plakobranchus ocellatus]|uniref:Perlucin n=1 Tax=Plakobranchus ocellatus TaxID=259542 RepID=A0AAV4DVZ6_9GAST|nr:perlucin [Plakobranchus ocellatus]
MRSNYDYAWDVEECYVSDSVGHEKCEALGGSLAKILSEDESTIIKNFLNQATLNLKTYSAGVWIGGRPIDETIDADWEWVSDGSKITGFDDWGDDKPDSAGMYRGGSCLALSPDEDWSWHDQDCYTDGVILCEGTGQL